MAEEQKPRAEAKPVEKFDPDAPIWLAVDQADTRNYFEPFTGWDAEKQATEYAAERSARLKRPVFIAEVVAIARPPENPVGEVKRVKLTPPAEEAKNG